MADEDDAHAAIRSPPRISKSRRTSGLRQRCGRLIENEDVGVNRERPSDGHDGPFRARETSDVLVDVDVAAHRGQDLLCTICTCDHEIRPRGRCVAGHDSDVLRDAELGEQAQVLVDEGDAALHGGVIANSPQLDAARVWSMDTGEDLDERRLAGAVLADERVDLTDADVEVDVIECEGARKLLRQAADRAAAPRELRCHPSARCVEFVVISLTHGCVARPGTAKVPGSPSQVSGGRHGARWSDS